MLLNTHQSTCYALCTLGWGRSLYSTADPTRTNAAIDASRRGANVNF